MGNIDNQRAGAAGPAPQRRKLANLCFVLCNLTLLYRLLCYIPELSVPYLPVVSLWFLPYLFLGVGAYLLFAVPGRETYNQKTSNILFILAAIFFLLPRLVSMASGQPFGLTELAFCTALTYLALGFGCFVRFLEYDRLMKMSCWFMIVPGIFLGLMIVYHPIEALAVGIVLVVALAIFFGRLKYKYGMTKKQKDMIKGAVVGSFIAGDGGAVVGAMVAKEKHEGASSDPFGASIPSAAKDMVKGAAIGSIVAGDGGAIAGAMIAKEKHNQKNSK